MRVVGCFLEYKGKFVILLRQAHKPEGGTWALPSGKVEAGETDIEAVIRELAEETGYKASPEELAHLGEFVFTTSTGAPYTYVVYRLKLQQPHVIQLERAAHAAYKWTSAEVCYNRPDLIVGLHELLRQFQYVRQ